MLTATLFPMCSGVGLYAAQKFGGGKDRVKMQTWAQSFSQDAHRRLLLQVYLGSNTLEFSDIRR